MRAGELFERLSAMGAAAQASVPGFYAWGVTVAPPAWARGSSPVARVAAIAALLMLAAGVVGEPRWGGRARFLSLWGFVLASAVVWSAAPAALSPLRMDAPRGLAGMLGWALFAFASAAPALRTALGEAGKEPAEDAPLVPHQRLARGDGAYVAGGSLAAALLQGIGWRVVSVERSLLVRFIALAAGLAVMGAATEIALVRHSPRAVPSRSRRLRRALVALVALGVLALAGLLLVVLD
jgi:hypothetical protein